LLSFDFKREKAERHVSANLGFMIGEKNSLLIPKA